MVETCEMTMTRGPTQRNLVAKLYKPPEEDRGGTARARSPKPRYHRDANPDPKPVDCITCNPRRCCLIQPNRKLMIFGRNTSSLQKLEAAGYFGGYLRTEIRMASCSSMGCQRGLKTNAFLQCSSHCRFEFKTHKKLSASGRRVLHSTCTSYIYTCRLHVAHISRVACVWPRSAGTPRYSSSPPTKPTSKTAQHC